MAENSTPAPQGGKVSSLYRLGVTIVFKYEGNVRARVTGHQVMDGKVWIEAHAADVSFLIPLPRRRCRAEGGGLMLARRRVLNRSPFVEKPVEAGSRRWLIAELDRLTSLIVRYRDRRCVTCGERRGLQCSHFYSRRHLNTRFDLRNCNAMCVSCNRWHNSDPTPYLRFMNERHGPEVVAELDRTRAETRKVTDGELLETLERLKQAL